MLSDQLPELKSKVFSALNDAPSFLAVALLVRVPFVLGALVVKVKV